MRVCTPHCGLDPESALGGEVYEREVLRSLAERGVVFDILLARHKRVPEGVPNWVVHRLPVGRGLRWPVAPLVLPPVIKRVYKATRFHLLRVHSLRYIGPAALVARRCYGVDVPIVAHHHHLELDRFTLLVDGRVMRGVDRVIVGSEFARRQAVDTLGIPSTAFSVVPYGVDRRYQRRTRPDRLVRQLGLAGKVVGLFVGRLEPRKNPFLLLDVWHEVVRERRDAMLVVAGSGSLTDALRRRAHALGLDGHVAFVGHVPEADKVEYYNAADLLLFPSAVEGFGLAVAEAMSCELPVVVSDRGSLPELVVDGEGGFVCDPADQGSFVRKTLLLLSDPMLRRKLGAANRLRVDRLFRWDICASATGRVYEDVLAAWWRRPSREVRS